VNCGVINIACPKGLLHWSQYADMCGATDMSNRILSLAIALLWLPASFGQSEPATEIIVLGRQPGPPLWQVISGEHSLWIFPMLSAVPEGFEWESGKVAAVIATADEYLPMPGAGMSVSPLLLLNPLNIYRGLRLVKRLSRNPDGATLEEVLPAALHARFASLQARYFPENRKINALRPMLASESMVSIIHQEEGLVSGNAIRKKIRQLVDDNPRIKHTDVSVNQKIEDKYRNLAKRAEEMMASVVPAQEIACFESRVSEMERDIDEKRVRALAWAQGYVDEFRGIPLPGDAADTCMNMFLPSADQELMSALMIQVQQDWVLAAEQALLQNKTTFAVLGIPELLKEHALLAQLRAKGYEIREP